MKNQRNQPEEISSRVVADVHLHHFHYTDHELSLMKEEEEIRHNEIDASGAMETCWRNIGFSNTYDSELD